MLTQLSIKNFALIDQLLVDFDNGLSIITGETGAGKSIILGGLGLITGKRADLSSLKDVSKKCIIEGTFAIDAYQLHDFFNINELDYDSSTIIRREILPSGKSRAFVNDTPVRLDVLNQLGKVLIDIHSQHQTLQLTESKFQFRILDVLGEVGAKLTEYQSKLAEYQHEKRYLEKLYQDQAELIKEQDYNTFLLQELTDAKLDGIVLEDLETSFEQLNNVEEIKEQLGISKHMLTDEQFGVLEQLQQMQHALGKLSGYAKVYEEIYNRIQSVHIELDDVFQEIQQLEDAVESDPQHLEEIQEKLQKINDLQKKHQVQTIEELVNIQEQLSVTVDKSDNIASMITQVNERLVSLKSDLQKIGRQIHQKRKQAIPTLTKQLEQMLALLGMGNAKFKIQLESTEVFRANGMDELQFLFSANKGGNFQELKKAASGGELSRVMFCIKAILSKYTQLPTIMFDEIDAGISGEIANKMGSIMSVMGDTMQVFAITHLPQIAAKGKHHFKVYKKETGGITTTYLTQLSQDERITEIAQMLSGANVSDSALANAKELMK